MSSFRQVCLLTIGLCTAAALGACGDGDGKMLTRDASAIERRDAAGDDGLDASESPDDQEPDAQEPDEQEPDAQEELDAQEPDAGEDQPDADAPESGPCPEDQPADACGECGGDGSSCTGHALTGRYAVRTQLYARQKARIDTTDLDLVSKGVLLSIADIDAQGVVNEHYCLLEIANPEVPVFSWTAPATVENVPDTAIQLQEQAGRYVRPLAEHRGYFSWSPDCTAGPSGCQCPTGGALPSNAQDCRVTDIDEDGVPGGAMYLDFEFPADPSVPSSQLTLSIVALLNLEWRIGPAQGDHLVGDIAGGLEQAVLSLDGALEEAFGSIKNAVCPPELGHVELVRGDFSCTELLAARASESTADDIFDTELDGQPPEPDVCPDPNCGGDADHDGTSDCSDLCPTDAAKTAPGACGCGIAETNTDGDTLPDCTDQCDADRNKTVPGACGCGVAETNADGDAAPDCTDQCDTDRNKIVPGACGCGVAETNTDGDAAPDCTDQCDADRNKTAPGACGCGVAETNTDGDAMPDCTDQCDADRNKTVPGACGCGVADTNTDGDSLPDCRDQCDADRNKTVPGACGCGVPETNTDGDALPDCTDQCDADRNKTVPGACGCGNAETNTDGDAAPDCTDQCDTDRNKTVAGVCGCGVPETNTDGDSQPDCRDQCDNDRNKTAPGACGCGVADTNTDGDAMPDCTDQCDSDRNKTVPGVCGCGAADRDLNGDGTIDCSDTCPNDPNKVAPGICGCGVADTNSDGDARVDCQEDCDRDPNKIAAGQCGCGVIDTDSDGDGVANCNDACANDRAKTTLGLCGCGVPDTNSDGDAAPDCTDQCDADRNKTVPGACGCGVAETNTDGDAMPDCTDQCDSDRNKTAPGACGCGVADTNTDGDSMPDCTDQCDADPTRTAPGPCGCADCTPSPLAGRYAVRTAVFGKQRNGSEVLTSKSLAYSLITITENASGSLTLSEQGCWSQSVPNPNEGGTQAYSWSKPAWVQAIPPVVNTLVASGSSYTRNIGPTHYGWNPARQPASCSATSTPIAPWASAWGSTCDCNTPASSLPPYDRNTAPYDCRLVDSDGDGQPGVSAIAATSAPSSPDANAPLIGGTAYAAVDARATWLITPASNGRHTATINDQGTAQVVGCSGLACSSLAETPPGNRACPQALNRAQFVPVTASSDTCAEIISTRNTLFVQNQDPAWPNNTACPPP